MRGLISSPAELLFALVYTLPAVLLAVSLHEFAHGFVSYKLGDPTPKSDGRLSLNPFHHLDLIGTLCLLVFHFGWAKPVQVNPRYYKNPKAGMAVTALAGPIMNFLVAFAGVLGMGILYRATGGYGGKVTQYFFNLFQYIAIINIGLGSFNLIPIPPLDGSKVLGAVLPSRIYFKYMRYERYGSILLIVLLFVGVLSIPLNFVQQGIFSGMWNVMRLIVGI
ncbi:site-2 protease family protein [Diplocloster modestus]|uniref:Site-2 protease family protein n=1 Tax=Diplocloster modestus TaxID=2850322 RepID=A0ABS6K959_9FIRM|nr:site-2 protease family protein [Diplocloster modestus]MBU9727053.1 site-2 protease family protein [Diplocloster modestus]